LSLLLFPAPPPSLLSTLSLHDALPILIGLLDHVDLEAALAPQGDRINQRCQGRGQVPEIGGGYDLAEMATLLQCDPQPVRLVKRSEEHTSELQSQSNLVCRLLLEKKKK